MSRIEGYIKKIVEDNARIIEVVLKNTTRTSEVADLAYRPTLAEDETHSTYIYRVPENV